MSRKRRKKRRKPRPPGSGAPGRTTEAATEAATAATPPPRRRGLFQAPGDRPPPAYPKLGVSLAAGFRAVGSSPAILAVTFLASLATWGAMTVLGTGSVPQLMALQLALSPAHVFFDVGPVFQAAATGFPLLGAIGGLAVLRAATFAILVLLIGDRLRGATSGLRGVSARLPKVLLTMFAIYIVEVGLVVLLLRFAGPQFGVFGLALALFFLLMAPVVAGMERSPAREAFRRSVRAALLPGTRHLGMVGAYLVFLVALNYTGGAGFLAPATPALLTWVFALTAGLIHVAFLGALCFRWLDVRDQVPSGPRPRDRVKRVGRT